MAKNSGSAKVTALLGSFDRAYNRRSWHGTNLRGAIRGLSAGVAGMRPGPGRHNIWELVVHAAYWKYAVRRRIARQARGSFELKGSNWFERNAGQADDEVSWRRDVALLERTHSSLRATIERLHDSDLARTLPGSRLTVFDLITGAAAHDLYHAGQIQLIKRLLRTGNAPPAG